MKIYAIAKSEIKYQLKSPVFYIFTAVVVLFYITQFGFYNVEDIKPPKQGADGYGFTSRVTAEEEMQSVANQLKLDLASSETIQLNGITKRIKIKGNIGNSMKDLLNEIENKKINFKQYRTRVNEIDELLGGNTLYGDKFRNETIKRPLKYEEAVEIFNEKIKTGITDAYGRYLADYLGITAGIFPVFLAAFILSRDRRTRMDELIKVRNFNSFKYILGKYIAIASLMGLVYLIIAAYPTYEFYKICSINQWKFNPFGFFKYVFAWIIPTLLFTTAMAMAIAEITTSGLAAVAIQFLWWFNSLVPLKGDYSLTKYVIRFNTTEDYDLIINSLDEIFINRLFYLSLVPILIYLCIWAWNKRRITERGNRFEFIRLFTANKIQRQDT